MAFRRAAFNGNTSLSATFSSRPTIYYYHYYYRTRTQVHIKQWWTKNLANYANTNHCTKIKSKRTQKLLFNTYCLNNSLCLITSQKHRSFASLNNNMSFNTYTVATVVDKRLHKSHDSTECQSVIRTTLKVNGKAWDSAPAIRKRLNRWLPKLAGVTTSRISTPVQNCITIRLGYFAPTYAKLPTKCSLG